MIYAAVFGLLLACFALVFIVARPSGQEERVTVALERLEGYDPRVYRATELAAPAGERLFQPVVATLAGLGRRITPVSRLHHLGHKLEMAGRPWKLDVNALLAIKLLALAGATVGLLVLASLHLISARLFFLAAVGAAVFSYYLPDLILAVATSERKRSIQRQLPDFLDLLTVTVEAGLGLDSALARIAEKAKRPLKEEILITLHHMRIGRSREEALRAMADRCGVKDLDNFVAAVIQSTRLGVSLGQVMRVQSAHIRVLRRQRVQEAGQKAPVKLIFPLMFCIFPALFVVILGPAAIRIYEMFTEVW